ncbi:MAG: ATP-binding protein [Bacteroidota bacterium]
MNKQLQTLLTDSFTHYKARRLKKALNAAQIALEFGLNEAVDSQGLFDANILLSHIYDINGQYQNEPSSFQKATQHLQDAEALNLHPNGVSNKIKLHLIKGKLCFHQKQYEDAALNFTKSLTLSRKINDHQGIIKSFCQLSQLATAKNDIHAGISWAEEALAYLKYNIKENHKHLWCEVWLQLSQAYIKMQEYSKSLEMSQDLLAASKQIGDVEKEIIALRNIAVVCGIKSNYKIGMQYFLEAIDKCKAIGYQELFVQLQVNIGTLYAHLYNYPEAIRRYRGVLEEFDGLLEDRNKLVVYNNLGNIYLSTQQPKTALQYFEKSLFLAEQLGYSSMQAHALAQLSRARLQLGELASAKEDAKAAQTLLDSLGNINGKQINLLNRGEIHYRDGELDLAKALTLKAIEVAKQVKDDACEIRCYKHLARIFKAKGEFKTALEYEEKYGEIQEAFAKEQYDRQFLDMEIRHAIKEKQKAIEALTKENEFQALLLKKSDQIATQNQELIRMNEDLKQFAYVASHDLKEPIRMIGSFTQIIQKKTRNLLEEKDHQYFEFINGGVNRMNELLDGLLKYATVGNLEINMEDIDMNKVAIVSLANLHIRISETEADIRYDLLPSIYSNRSLIIQLFQNLISNAIKFTKPGQHPVIKIGYEETGTSNTFYVKDNGIGISKESQQKIFEIFQRLHARETYEGTGIGLAICQKIVKRLGGTLWVESEPGEGSTFFFSIPKRHNL